MTSGRPAVWFERPPLDEFAAEVAATCTVMQPSADDPNAGLEAAHAVIAGPRTYDAVVMDRAPRLRVIARTGIGYDGVDIAAATNRGIAICNTPDGPTNPRGVAIGLMLAVVEERPGCPGCAARTRPGISPATRASSCTASRWGWSNSAGSAGTSRRSPTGWACGSRSSTRSSTRLRVPRAVIAR